MGTLGSCLEGCGRLSGDRDACKQAAKSLGSYVRKQWVRSLWEGKTVRTSQVKGPYCILL